VVPPKPVEPAKVVAEAPKPVVVTPKPVEPAKVVAEAPKPVVVTPKPAEAPVKPAVQSVPAPVGWAAGQRDYIVEQ
jgi:hypothetical protein